METTQVPAGYKVTDLGVLPEEWEVKRLAEIASIGSGGTPNRKVADYWGGKIPWVTTAQIDFNVVENAEQFITDSGLKKSSAKLFKKGALLMAMYGQGKTRGKVAMLGIDATTNQACAVITLKEAVLSSYVLYNLTGRYEELRELSNSGGQENLSSGIIKNFLIPLPPIAEQQAIAAALGEMDALLAAQRARLAKQRAVKKGLLQGLLSGAQRLPEFAGEWEVKRLGELGKTYGGLTGKSKVDFDNGNAPYVTFLNVISNTVIDTKHFGYVRIKPADNQNKVLRGDMLFNTSSETPEEVGMCAVLKEEIPNLHLNSFCFGFRLNNQSETVADYLVYYLRSSFGRQLFYATAQGATRYNLSKVNFNKLVIPLPTPDEQRAIADVLSAADAHLTALEAEHAKTQLLKQGMMQNLLTGKIRLV